MNLLLKQKHQHIGCADYNSYQLENIKINDLTILSGGIFNLTTKCWNKTEPSFSSIGEGDLIICDNLQDLKKSFNKLHFLTPQELEQFKNNTNIDLIITQSYDIKNLTLKKGSFLYDNGTKIEILQDVTVENIKIGKLEKTNGLLDFLSISNKDKKWKYPVNLI